MSTIINIKPAAAGSKVHLEGQGRAFLPAKGAAVERTVYWSRRLRDGSVVEVTAKAANTAKATKEK